MTSDAAMTSVWPAVPPLLRYAPIGVTWGRFYCQPIIMKAFVSSTHHHHIRTWPRTIQCPGHGWMLFIIIFMIIFIIITNKIIITNYITNKLIL